MTYKLLPNGAGVTLLSDAGNAVSSIPADPDNADYQAFLAWEAAGNTPLPADPPPPPTQNDLDIAAAKAYAKLTALKSMTPAQIQAWVTANVTNLAQVQDAITTLAIAVAILARRM